MEIAVLSDLHIGRGDSADRFRHAESDFLRFLRHLESSHDRIILLGDIYETLASSRLGRAEHALRAAQQAHPRIAERFASSKYTYLHGNHDLVAGRALGAPEELTLSVDGQRLLFMHGHQFDRILQRARWLESLGVWAAGWLMRLGLQKLYDLSERLHADARGAKPQAEECPFQAWAVGTAAARGADIVITGHTHIATRAEHDGHLFLNSGTCIGRRFSFVHIDTRNRRYEVVSETFGGGLQPKPAPVALPQPVLVRA